MTEDVEQKALELSEKLERLTERLNNAIREVEHAFEDLGFTTPAFVVMQKGMEHAPEVELRLWFSKSGSGKWHLSVERCVNAVRSPSIPLLQCSRKIRADSVDFLPALKMALEASSTDLADHIENRLRTAQEFIESLKK